MIKYASEDAEACVDASPNTDYEAPGVAQALLCIDKTRVATVRKISGKWNFYQVREFCGWPGKFRKDLESQRKVREFENKWLWQAVFRKFILFKRGKDVHSYEIV